MSDRGPQLLLHYILIRRRTREPILPERANPLVSSFRLTLFVDLRRSWSWSLVTKSSFQIELLRYCAKVLADSQNTKQDHSKIATKALSRDVIPYERPLLTEVPARSRPSRPRAWSGLGRLRCAEPIYIVLPVRQSQDEDKPSNSMNASQLDRRDACWT